MSINRVNISGNLTRDPELRATQGGTEVLSFGMAVNDRRKNPQTGEWEEYPNFVDCALFGARAGKLRQLLAKGSKVAVDGRLRYRSWQDRQTGAKRSALEVVVEDIDLMSRQQAPQGAPQYAPQAPQAPQPARQPVYAPQAAPQAPRPQQAPQYAPQPQQAPQAPCDLYDEDIPF